MGAAAAALGSGPPATQLAGAKVAQLGCADRSLVAGKAESVGYVQGGKVDHEHARGGRAHRQDQQRRPDTHRQFHT